ncbi:hypothetical protein [Burkholderia sp.]|uniref:hypothetical protein n=1 Tax=Burkholderia sp. TaxID=36773 RepID=UPI002586FB14|nr:hypothetical protein [Burkholderia sp.]MCL4631515.1 hypothetical protein [Burkholderia sp.]
MSNYAVVQEGKVVNIVVWDGDETAWQPPEGCQAFVLSQGEMVEIGEKYIDTSGVAATPGSDDSLTGTSSAD